MRNRQMIVRWLMANTKAIDVRTRDGKTYYVMTDPQAFREGAGRLLAEVQRIKAEGDYAAARAAVRDLRRALRSQAARRGGGARRSPEAAVVHRVRHAEARGGDRCRRARSRDVTISYPQRLCPADARVFGRDAAAAAVNVFVPHAGRSHAEPPDRGADGGPGWGPRRFSISRNRTRPAPGSTIPADLLRPLADPRGLTYAPAPFGLLDARAAVARDYARRGLSVTPERIALTASTSEAYGCLFKLLADAGRRGARSAAKLSAVRSSGPAGSGRRRVRTISIPTADGGSTSTLSRARSRARTRAVLLVSPNNPTGSFVKRRRARAPRRAVRGARAWRWSPTRCSPTTS